MIPQLPFARELRLSDHQDVEAITSNHPPYCDFNFISLWSWDIDASVRVCLHHGNLVFRFPDYLSRTPFYMLLGRHRLDDAIHDVMELAAREGIEPRLQLIPECVAASLNRIAFVSEPNPDHRDYIIDVQDLAACQGRKWHRQRNFIHRFEREHPSGKFVQLDLSSSQIRSRILDVFECWCEQKCGEPSENIEHEQAALQRCLEAFASRLVAGGVYVRDKLVAFSLTEEVRNSYAIDHFEKSDRWSHSGVLQFLQWQVARLLRDRGVRYLNLEQDLGLPGLRRGKQALHPIAYLQKYEIAAISESGLAHSHRVAAASL